jgi:hypothetical protein
MADEQGSFIFGGNTGLSYQELQQRRAIAAALAGKQKGFPKTKGEGMTYLGDAFAEGINDLMLHHMEQKQKTAEANLRGKATPGTYTPAGVTAAPAPAPVTAPGYDPKVSTIDTERPPPPTAAPVAPPPAPAAAAPASIPGGPWTAPAITAPPPWPVSEGPPPPDMPPFAQRFADAVPSAPPPSAASAQQENTFFQPELATPSFSGGTVADLTPADIPPMPAQRASITAPAPAPQQTAMLSPAADPQMMMFARQEERPPEPPPPVSQAPEQAPIDVASSAPVPSPDVPLPRGDPRTVGGVQATMRNEFARAGYTPTAIGGTMPNARDESGFNWSDASRHIDQHNPKFAGTEAMYSHGLFQEGGEDWNKMQAWLDKNYPGYSRQDPALQSRFTAENLKESTPKAFEAMQNAPTEGQAADAMLRGYLRPSAPNVASRSASYLAGTGAQPAPATAIAMGGGGSGGMRDREGSPVQADPRDAVTAALLDQPVQQPQQVAQEAPPEGGASDARLLEMLGGGRRPGSPFLPTASIGREGAVRSDAPLPGLSPMGSLGGGPDASLQDRRDAITRAVIDQPVTAPEVPQPDPTQSGTSPSPTTASLPPTSPSVISDSSTVPPMGATAQAAMPMAPPVGYGDAVGTLVPPARAADTSQGVTAAPTQAAPAPAGSTPSQEAIQPASEQQRKPPGAPPVQPPPLGPSRAMAEAALYMNNPNVSPETRAYYKNIYDTEEKFRGERDKQKQDAFVNKRGLWQEDVKDYQKWVREGPDRTIKQLNERLQAEMQQANINKVPLDRAKLTLDIENSRADLEKKYYDTGIPRDQAQRKAELEIAELKRKVNEPDKFQAQGTQYERPQGADKYSIAPGAPAATLSEPQQRAIVFAERAKPDLDLLDKELNYGKALTKYPSGIGSGIPYLGNVLVSDEYRRARNAIDNWASGLLNFVSGSAVSPSEAARNIPAFVPMVGDTDQDIRDKSDRRRQLMEVVGKVSGTAGETIIKSLNDSYSAQDAAVKEQRALPPVQVTSPDDVKDLQPGRRLILPDGKPGEVPRRR